MTGRYASSTEVSTDRSKAEIERILARYGADQFMSGWESRRAVLGFRIHGRQVRIDLPLPDRNADEFRLTPSKKYERSESDQVRAYEQACRQLWRALALVVKAKLEAVEARIATFDEEFLSYIVLPDNTTVGEHLLPQVAQSYLDGKMPLMLPEGGK